MEHFYIFCSPRGQGSLKGPECRVHETLALAPALLCSFLPEISVHSTTLVLREQVSHCSQKFTLGSSHLAAGNISMSDLTIEVLAAKGSSPAPSSPVYQRLRLVPSQHQLRWGLPVRAAQAQGRPTLLLPSHHLLFQGHVSRA